MRAKMRKAMKPDSYESFLPSQMGRTKKRRMKRPAMETATSAAQAAANQK